MTPSRNTAGREYTGIHTKQLFSLLYNVSLLTKRHEKEAQTLAETAPSELNHLLRILIRRIPANTELERLLSQLDTKQSLGSGVPALVWGQHGTLGFQSLTCQL